MLIIGLGYTVTVQASGLNALLDNCTGQKSLLSFIWKKKHRCKRLSVAISFYMGFHIKPFKCDATERRWQRRWSIKDQAEVRHLNSMELCRIDEHDTKSYAFFAEGKSVDCVTTSQIPADTHPRTLSVKTRGCNPSRFSTQHNKLQILWTSLPGF